MFELNALYKLSSSCVGFFFYLLYKSLTRLSLLGLVSSVYTTEGYCFVVVFFHKMGLYKLKYLVFKISVCVSSISVIKTENIILTNFPQV